MEQSGANIIIDNNLKFEEMRALNIGMSGSPGLVVMGEERCSRGREFECQHWTLEGHIYLL